MKWFNSLPRLVQFVLLLIPIVNWIVEIFVRVTALIHKTSLKNVLGCLAGLFIPIWGYVDLVWVLLFHHLALTE